MKRLGKFPHVGARMLKTGITVFICTLVSMLVLKRDSGFIASMSGITCLQNNLENSVNTGVNRIKGTIVGAVIGIIVMLICNSVIQNNNSFWIATIASIGIIATIYICAVFSISDCTATAMMMFLILIMSIGEEQWVSYSIMRTFDTFIGVIIGILVNKYVLVDSFKNVKND